MTPPAFISVITLSRWGEREDPSKKHIMICPTFSSRDILLTADADAPDGEKATISTGKTRKQRQHFHIFFIEAFRLLLIEKILKNVVAVRITDGTCIRGRRS